MKIATTTGDFSFYCSTDEERIRELHQAGFRYIDLNMYSFTPECDYMNDHWQEAAYRIKNLANELGMQFVQAHSQGGNPLSEDPAHVDFLLKATLRSIEICEFLGIKNTVVHNGFAKGLSKEEWFVKNKEFYEVEKDVKAEDEIDESETLSCDIIIHIADKTAERFEDMADGMEMTTLKQIVRKIEEAEPETIVPMLQTMFLARGMVDAAKDLDMLELCFRYDEDTYYLFYDILFDSDIFDWFSIENMFDDYRNEGELNPD